MRVTVVEVGPRDGLQNEALTLGPEVRAELCDRLAETGISRMEAARFVNPKLVPQMAGAEEVLGAIHRRPGVRYAGLVLNERGYERARAAGVDEVRYSFGVTETFCRRNQNASVDGAIELAQRLIWRAREDGLPIGIVLSVAFGCPFEGPVDPARVLEVAGRVVAEGTPDEVILADTIGVGVPSQVRELVAGLRAYTATPGCHFHNTRNTGLANALAAVEAGAAILDSSVGGTGGCPFAPRATGNIATEDLVYLLHGMDYQTGIDLDGLIACAAWLAEKLGRVLPGMVYRAGNFPAAG